MRGSGDQDVETMKLNLGAGRDWSREGWTTLDHRILRPFRLPYQAWDLPWADKTFAVVFSSHMIEHISHFRIERTICEINRIMSPNGILRLLTPDLETLCRAYVNRDVETLRRFIREDNGGTGNGIREDLGPAQMLLGFLYSPGGDNYLIDSSRSALLGGYAHLFCYDYELLSNLLKSYGFGSIERKSVDESAIPDHKWLRVPAHDIDRGHSLVIECRKEQYVPFSSKAMVMLNGPYSYEEVVACSKYPLTKLALGITSRCENSYRWLRQTAGKLVRRVRGL